MKTITCLDCEEQFSGETKKEVLEAMMPHYMEVHKDVMDAGNEEKKQAWFAEFERQWNEVRE